MTLVTEFSVLLTLVLGVSFNLRSPDHSRCPQSINRLWGICDITEIVCKCHGLLHMCFFLERVFITFIHYSSGFLMQEDSEPLISSIWKPDIGKPRNLNSRPSLPTIFPSPQEAGKPFDQPQLVPLAWFHSLQKCLPERGHKVKHLCLQWGMCMCSAVSDSLPLHGC